MMKINSISYKEWTHCTWLCFGEYISLVTMDLFPDTQNRALRMRRECRGRFPRHRLKNETAS